MGLAASGQLIDRYAAVFLPGASSRDRSFAGGIRRQRVANLTPAADQAIEVGQVRLDLRSQALIHGSCPSLLESVCQHTNVFWSWLQPSHKACTIKSALAADVLGF